MGLTFLIFFAPYKSTTHLSQEEINRRLFGDELLELFQLGERLVVPLRREEDGGALELAQ